MSAGSACACPERNIAISERKWRVMQRYSNHSAFSGYHYTPSNWSSIRCLRCDATWRTKANYVAHLPNITEKELKNMKLGLGEAKEIPKSQCLDCGYPFELTSSVTEDGVTKTPSPGDISICINCGHLMAFADDMTMRQLTDDEMITVAGDERIIQARRAQDLVRREKIK